MSLTTPNNLLPYPEEADTPPDVAADMAALAGAAETALDLRLPTTTFTAGVTAKLGVANGIATLDADGLVPVPQLPSGVGGGGGGLSPFLLMGA